MRNQTFLLAVASLLLTGGAARQAFADAATEAQLRAALQAATAQIAQLEDQVANLQAAEAPNVATIEALRAQLQAQSGKSAAGPSAAEKARSDAALAAMKRQLAAQAYSLDKTQSAYQAASSQAGAAASQNKALTARLAALQGGLASCQRKNAKLYSIGNQILDAYSHKDDLFAAFADHEPFTQIKRVQLQNIVQSDQDKLDDNQITP